MQGEEIIRKEAKEFHDWNIDESRNNNAIDDFHQIKYRLQDFYTPESKALFLDELQRLIILSLKEHRDKAHGGQPGLNCAHEAKPEKLLFYIQQEMDTLPIIAHQKKESNPVQHRTKVFISYSHYDIEYLTDIKRHFKPFFNKIDFWDDSKIQPGQKWKLEISKAIETTKVAILLVSTDFLGSEFISTNELPPLLKAAEENGAVILIVLLKPCLFEEFDELNQYQTMNPSNNPVVKMDVVETEELYVNLVRQTKRILEAKS